MYIRLHILPGDFSRKPIKIALIWQSVADIFISHLPMFLIPDDFWNIRHTKDKGRGVFARKIIPAGTIIGDYIGTVIRTSMFDVERDAQALYLMYRTDETSIYPDLTVSGIHLINHSCQPNCWMYMYRGHTLFFALRDISVGEELTISYLLSPKDDTCAPCTHECKCKSFVCTGTMHLSPEKYEAWQKFQRTETKRSDVIRASIGTILPKLTAYPDIDIHHPIYAYMNSQ